MVKVYLTYIFAIMILVIIAGCVLLMTLPNEELLKSSIETSVNILLPVVSNDIKKNITNDVINGIQKNITNESIVYVSKDLAKVSDVNPTPTESKLDVSIIKDIQRRISDEKKIYITEDVINLVIKNIPNKSPSDLPWDNKPADNMINQSKIILY
jgi:energy-converting hydrogenase Eha subunit A